MRVVHLGHMPLMAGHPDFARVRFRPARWVYNIARAQVQFAGIEAHIIMVVPGGSADFTTERDGVTIHYLKVPTSFRASTLFHFDSTRVAKAALALNPDFVHAHGTEDVYPLAARKTGLPCVITLQSCYFLLNRKAQPKLFSQPWFIEISERQALTRATDVIAKVGSIEEAVQKRFPSLRVHRISNTFDQRILELDWEKPRLEPTLVFVGAVVRRKGFHILREALELIDGGLRPKIKLHVFGNAAKPSEYEQTELQKVRALLGSNLILHGMKPYMEMLEQISECRFLVAPSIEEMYGNAVIESLLVGTPVIVTDETAMAENVRLFGNGRIIAQRDPAALSSAITVELRPGRFEWDREAAGEARERIEVTLGPKVIARSHLDLYNEIIARPRPA